MIYLYFVVIKMMFVNNFVSKFEFEVIIMVGDVMYGFDCVKIL